jgi:hypothetical protein
MRKETTDTDDAETVEKKIPGHIDIVNLFQAEALDLVGAVVRGRLLHKTRNIRDSGAPLEAKLRDFFRSKLPQQFDVMQGYFFDIQSNCTPQVDAMIIKAVDRHELMVSQEGAGYVPFTSALALIEVKNSAQNIRSNLDQLFVIVSSIRGMQKDLRDRRPNGGPILNDPISIMFFGNSENAKLEDFKDWFEKNPMSAPTYTVLLDKGVIITKRNLFSEIFEYDSEQLIDFYEHKNGHEI